MSTNVVNFSNFSTIFIDIFYRTMSLKKEVTTNKINLIEKKVAFFHDVIQKTLLHIQYNKSLDIVEIVDINNCVNVLDTLNEQVISITNIIEKEKEKDIDIENIINILQKINVELSTLFRKYGTQSFEDFLWICYGNNSINNHIISDMDKYKFDILKKYFHPTCYRILNHTIEEESISLNDNESSNIITKSKEKEKITKE
jgi:hypothetical protein